MIVLLYGKLTRKCKFSEAPINKILVCFALALSPHIEREGREGNAKGTRRFIVVGNLFVVK